MTALKPFSTSPGDITDFSGVAPADIFNEAILPRANSLLSVLEQSIVDLDEASAARQERAASSMEADLYADSEDDNFLAEVAAQKPQQAVEENYDAPVAGSPEAMADATSMPTLRGEAPKGGIKLSNYGYDSDSSPDYNSNVLKIGHSNNKLVDGVSAALTKSLAKRLGLKTGDYFEAVTADGKVLRRRYDDTVPTTYRGRRLPETVDLYELKGSNKFGGKVIDIRPLKGK